MLYIRLATNKEPEAFAVFALRFKDGSIIRTNAVLDVVEKVKVLYRHRDDRDLRVYDIEKVVYDGSECMPNQNSEEHMPLYSFNVDVDEPCRIKKHAKLVLVYSDGTKYEVCGEYAGITVYQVTYRSCIDVDTEKLESVKLVSMGFRPEV